MTRGGRFELQVLWKALSYTAKTSLLFALRKRLTDREYHLAIWGQVAILSVVQLANCLSSM